MKLKWKMAAMFAAALAAFAVIGAEEGAAKTRKPRPQAKIFTKADAAQKEAQKFEQPILVIFTPEGSKDFEDVKKLIFKSKMKKAVDDFMRYNMVVLDLKLKPDQKDEKKVNMRALKDIEVKLVQNFGLDAKRAAREKKNNKELKSTDMSNYPAMVLVQNDLQKELFRLTDYDKRGGPGVWLTGLIDQMRMKAIEPVITPRVQPVVDEPMIYAPAEKK